MNEAKIWDGFAGRYDTIVRLFDTSYPLVRSRLGRDLEGRPRVLEVAAGTGQFTLDLARAAEFVLSTDISPQMVGRLRRLLEEHALHNVEVAVMSAYALEAEAEAFDAVFCANALHVMDEPERALAEFRRVLVQGGVLIAPTFLHGVDGLRRALSRGLSLVSPFVASSRFDLDGLRALIETSGFEVLRAERLPGLFPLAHVVAKREA